MPRARLLHRQLLHVAVENNAVDLNVNEKKEKEAKVKSENGSLSAGNTVKKEDQSNESGLKTMFVGTNRKNNLDDGKKEAETCIDETEAKKGTIDIILSRLKLKQSNELNDKDEELSTSSTTTATSSSSSASSSSSSSGSTKSEPENVVNSPAEEETKGQLSLSWLMPSGSSSTIKTETEPESPPSETKGGGLMIPLLAHSKSFSSNPAPANPENAKPTKKVTFKSDEEEDADDSDDEVEQPEFWEECWDYILGDASLDDEALDDDSTIDDVSEAGSNVGDADDEQEQKQSPRFFFGFGTDTFASDDERCGEREADEGQEKQKSPRSLFGIAKNTSKSNLEPLVPVESKSIPESLPQPKRRRAPRFRFWEGEDDDNDDKSEDTSTDDGNGDFFNDDGSASLYSFHLSDWWDGGSYEADDESLDSTVASDDSSSSSSTSSWSSSKGSRSPFEQIQGPTTVLKHFLPTSNAEGTETRENNTKPRRPKLTVGRTRLLALKRKLKNPTFLSSIQEESTSDSIDTSPEEESRPEQPKTSAIKARLFALRETGTSTANSGDQVKDKTETENDIVRASSFNQFLKRKILNADDEDDSTESGSTDGESLAEMVDRILAVRVNCDESIPDSVTITNKTRLLDQLKDTAALGASWLSSVGTGGSDDNTSNRNRDRKQMIGHRLKRWTRIGASNDKININAVDDGEGNAVGFEVRDKTGKVRRKLWLRRRLKAGKIEVTDSDAENNVLSRRFLSPMESEKVEVMLNKQARWNWSIKGQKNSGFSVNVLAN